MKIASPAFFICNNGRPSKTIKNIKRAFNAPLASEEHDISFDAGIMVNNPGSAGASPSRIPSLVPYDLPADFRLGTQA